MRWQSLIGFLLLAQFGATAGYSANPQTPVSGGPVLTAPDLLESSGDLGSPELNYQDSEQPVLVSPDTASFQFYITDLESRQGPYAPGLSEQLLGLGAAYQKQGLHSEAAIVFKRGVHIARINNGLYSELQIPLLQRLIQSLVAIGDYDSADERQYYLYRVQAAVYGRQSAEMSMAMLERAEWEREAYYLSLGDTSFMRLLRMWELYSSVLRNVARNQGNHSPELLRPLEGLLETQYMISTYSPETPSGIYSGNGPDSNYAEESRFSMIRVSNYKQGQAVLTAMRDVYGYNEGGESSKPAETLVKIGDWHLWHQKRDSALDVYRQAWEELGALENGESLRQQYFGMPTLLPDLPQMRSEPAPPEVITGYVNVSFSVNQTGRIKNLEVLSNEPVDETAEVQGGNTVQLLRSIRRMLFRPQLVEGEPVQADDIQKRYAY
jgi:hypothetical protein